MGIIQKSKYDENNPPPFHLNVNNSYNDLIKKNKINNKNQIYQKEINNTKFINNNANIINNDYNNTNSNNNLLNRKKYGKEKNIIDDFSIDINIITKDKVEIKIPLVNDKNKIWQKEYNKKELIGTVINDYLVENKLDLPDNYFNQLKCFNKSVSFQDEIESLLPKEEINREEEEILYPEIIGKPFFSPFTILCFYKNEKKFVTLNYNKDITDKLNIENFDITSSYCNGYNHLYISGGENSLNYLWDIDLKKNIIDLLISDMPQKKYHSMIFIPKKIIFIVGGYNLDTFYYNLKAKKLIKWGNLNIIRLEPALQVINNKLFCFDCTNLKERQNEYSFECTELYSNNENKWELIKPKLNFNNLFNQQLFGVAKDKNDDIVFLGGKFNDEYVNIDYQKAMNFKLDTKKNEIAISEIKYKKFNLKERRFIPFNKTYDCILTDFQRSSPQICFFNKKKNKIELINFISNDANQKELLIQNKKENINNISPIFSFDQSLNNNNIGLRNPNYMKKFNTFSGNNYIFNNNIKKETPTNSVNNYILNKTQINPYGKTYNNILGKTPDKNIYRFKKMNYPNTYNFEKNKDHSADSRKFYHPKIGLQTNKKIYNYYSKNN